MALFPSTPFPNPAHRISRRGALRVLGGAALGVPLLAVPPLGVPPLGLPPVGAAAGVPHPVSTAAATTIVNGPLWTDTAGRVVQAHGGGILEAAGRYWWYGEDKSHNASTFRAVSCYSSTDLVHWTDAGPVLDTSSAAELADAKIERPKVVHDARTGRYVMWAHYERGADYSLARVAVATSATPQGPFAYRGSFRPLGQESRDLTVLVDGDGTGYLLTASNRSGSANDTMVLFRLTDDLLDVAEEVGTLFAGQHREAPALFRHADRYYLITSGASGWYPNQAMYATAPAVTGPWSALAPLGDPSTYSTQSTFVLTVGDRHLLMSDRWRPAALADSRYVWLPLQVDGGTLRLDWHARWDLTPDAFVVPLTRNLAAGRPATASSAATGSPASLACDGDPRSRWSAATATFPAWWQVDLGQVQQVDEVDVSWWMVRGSEGYYRYRILHGTDGVTWTTIDRTANTEYGFTADAVAFRARYVRIVLVDAVLHNNPTNWYTPSLYDVQVRDVQVRASG